jgi:putative flippase GtrA
MPVTRPGFRSLIGTGFINAETLRYIIGGSFTTIWYVGSTLVLSGPLDVPIQLAIPFGYVTALLMHFTLQRTFVFKREEGFALETRHQLRRYLTTAFIQYSLAAICTATLPSLLHARERLVYAVTALTLAAFTFLVLRSHVFH